MVNYEFILAASSSVLSPLGFINCWS